MANTVRTSLGEGNISEDGAPRRVRSAERVAAVLELLRDAPEPLRHAEIAAALRMPKSSTTNLLDTLVAAGLVARDGRGFALGIGLIGLGAAAAERLDVRRVALPVMRELSRQGIGTVNLAVLDGHDVRYVEKVLNPDHVIQIATRVGGTAPAHATALGKVLVAALSAAERERWIAAHRFTALTEHTIVEVEAFRAALRAAAADGYAIDEEEQTPRVVCFAAPVRDHAGATVAALSLTALAAEATGARRERQVATVVAGAGRVSARLGAG
jgi:DNA-binding IclR family transcriptional regulator